MFKLFKKISYLSLLSVLSLSSHAGLINPTSTLNSSNLTWSQSEAAGLQTFNEKQNIYITSNSIKVDYLLNENLSIGDRFTGVNHSHSNLFLDAGTYSSHLLHFDPFNTRSGEVRNQRISFTGDIVAIILGGEYLNLSDAILGDISTHYEKSISRRMEKHDLFVLESHNTLLVDRVAVGKYWIDDARILTREVTEPSSFSLLCLGALGLVFVRRRLYS